MEPSLVDVIGSGALIAIAIRLGWIVHKRSSARQPVYGGTISSLFNYLSAACFAAILPTVLMMVLVLHPENVQLGGIVWHPLILAVLALVIGSFGSALLHAVCERGPMARALQEETKRERRGWTKEDARSSGL
ncbi:MAG: hypothetical protein OXG78_09205 [Chloroflexi bacterium]|nr:hypothetical protein [Chloroflexota bacterium]